MVYDGVLLGVWGNIKKIGRKGSKKGEEWKKEREEVGVICVVVDLGFLGC